MLTATAWFTLDVRLGKLSYRFLPINHSYSLSICEQLLGWFEILRRVDDYFLRNLLPQNVYAEAAVDRKVKKASF